MKEFMSVKEVSLKASMSERTILKYLGEIKHTRHSPRGKVWIRWSDFEQWMERNAKEVTGDVEVMACLERLRAS